MLILRAPEEPNNIREYALQSSSRTRIQSFDSGGREVLARLGWSLFVRLLLCQSQPFALTEVHLQLIAGSSLPLSDTSGKLSEGSSHTGGRHVFVTTTHYHRPPWRY